MKRGFLFSIKRNQSQMTQGGRNALSRPSRVARARAGGRRSCAGAAIRRNFVRLAPDYWRVIKGFP
ncbi:hypothetical protein DF021_25425 [Burkholderia stagnalis]|uniref:Uncharacterized protein n=1 Tax=Burkholderia stagnalis TaxID=1503054 RepID=A0ABX9YJE9_9BURK|nr:hypothetical protein DF158_26600 [Burkholderia stagnalis]RQQ63755.1 hypothetical protein DF137_25930 [Burkholderia stagnalis]RQQ66399.1 hypothetical protein DF139_22025 [Burkholderia stagnalis]RQQ77247.1 hypothetical protein DF138_25535 [Burkholderia stagnalis]RQQ85372.1 hypothetical protein DF136_25040 [Burkholderia stagnalis]